MTSMTPTTPTTPIEPKTIRIAFPSMGAGGLEAPLSGHFGHSDVFTIVEVAETGGIEVETVSNAAHAQGGCMTPVMILKNAGADVLVAGGMGMRPLAGFQQVGIDVLFNEGASIVGDALRLVLSGKARRFGPAQACGGGGGGHHA